MEVTLQSTEAVIPREANTHALMLEMFISQQNGVARPCCRAWLEREGEGERGSGGFRVERGREGEGEGERRHRVNLRTCDPWPKQEHTTSLLFWFWLWSSHHKYGAWWYGQKTMTTERETGMYIPVPVESNKLQTLHTTCTFCVVPEFSLRAL